MADLEKLCEAVADAVSGLGVVQASAYPPDQLNTPAIVVEVDRIDWANTAMGRGYEPWVLLARVLIAPTNNQNAQLSRLRFFNGIDDVKSVIEDHPALNDGTAADSVFVREARKFDAWEYAGIMYIGAELVIEAVA